MIDVMRTMLEVRFMPFDINIILVVVEFLEGQKTFLLRK